jgi:two-component system chemotaxis response regulator CheB
MPKRDIIVVGASAGGVEALVTLVRNIPRSIPAAIFVVLHMSADSPSLLPEILSRAGPLAASQAKDGEEIVLGHIYVALPDNHLLVEKDKVRVVHGPRENRHRPAVDPLFRSAALAYGPRVVGVILSGALDDGTAGLLAVKRRGGIAIVQEPDEALYPSMPSSAQAHVAIDYTLPVAEIGLLLSNLAREGSPKAEGGYPMSDNLGKEVKKTELDVNELTADEQIGKPSVFSCPGCGGVLWEIQDGDLLRFRCRVGHAYSVESVLAEQDEALEDALWVALKTLEESADLSRRMAKQAHDRGNDWLASRFEAKLNSINQRIGIIRKVLLKGEIMVHAVPEIT